MPATNRGYIVLTQLTLSIYVLRVISLKTLISKKSDLELPSNPHLEDRLPLLMYPKLHSQEIDRLLQILIGLSKSPVGVKIWRQK